VRIKVGELPMGKNTLRVSNILGKMVYQNTIQANETATLDISRWTNGIYLYSISDEKGNILAGKRLNVVHP
jgi:hypothetical protein